MNSKNFKNIIDEVEFNSWQVLMSELDSTLNRMQYISKNELKDAYEIEQFDNFWDNVKNNEFVVVSVTDDTDLYEIDSNLIVLSEQLNDKMIIFDIQDKRKIISKITTSE